MTVTQEARPFGGRFEVEGGLPIACIDRYGHTAWSTQWDDGVLHELRIRGPLRDEVVVRPQIGEHPIFGACGGIFTPDGGEPIARFAAIDWAAPGCIMPVDVPGALPAGSGTAILNAVAILAARAVRGALRYRGPYPTAALFDSLMASFRPAGDTAAALATFTAEVEDRATRPEMVEIPVDFVPAPHEWTWTAPGVCVQQRDAIERVYVAGKAFDRILASHRTLVTEGDDDDRRWCGRIDLAGRAWAEVIRLDRDGDVIEGPHPLPAAPTELVGVELPREVKEVLGEILASRAPALLREAIVAELTHRKLVWADTGADVARLAPGRIELHAVLGERLPELDAHGMLVHLGGALEPIARRAAQQRLAQLVGP